MRYFASYALSGYALGAFGDGFFTVDAADDEAVIAALKERIAAQRQTRPDLVTILFYKKAQGARGAK